MNQETYLIAGISALSLAIAVMWRHIIKSEERCDKKLNEAVKTINNDRNFLWQAILDQNKKTCATGSCDRREIEPLPSFLIERKNKK